MRRHADTPLRARYGCMAAVGLLFYLARSQCSEPRGSCAGQHTGAGALAQAARCQATAMA